MEFQGVYSPSDILQQYMKMKTIILSKSGCGGGVGGVGCGALLPHVGGTHLPY